MSIDFRRRGQFLTRLVRASLAGLIVVGALTPAPVVAQTAQGGATPPPAAPPTGTNPAFVIQSDNGDNRLQIGGFVQMDARYALDDDQQRVTDTFTVRRFRSILQGRLYRHFEYYFNTDFAGGNVTVRDAYFDTVFSRALHVRVGKMKSPFSYERLILVSAMLPVERGLSTQVAPDRDTGIMALGDVAGGVISYAGFIGNGPVDGGLSDLDTNDAKELVGRAVIRPWGHYPKHVLSSLGVAIAASTTSAQPAGLPTFTSPGRQAFFSYSGATGDGERHRWSPQAFYYHGPFGAYGEYVHSQGAIRKGAAIADVEHESWQVVGSWVLTGEAAGERNVRPKVSFDPPTGHWGAFQVIGRIQSLSVSPNAVALGFTTAGSSRTAKGYMAGFNWFVAPSVKWNFDFERTVFDGDPKGPRHAENMVLVRAQFQL